MTKESTPPPAGRSVEARIEIKAPVEGVWKALTEADELQRWYPLEARVRPGRGGSIRLSWGSDWVFESAIEVWEPERHLRTVSEQAAPEAGKSKGRTLEWASAHPSEDASRRALRMTVDFFLEGKGGRTVLQIVHSGFGPGPEWNDEHDEVARGWPMEMRSLRLYLERHRGADRRVTWVRRTFEGSVHDAWDRLASPGGLVREGSLEDLRENDSWRITTTTGETLEGRVLVCNPPHGFAGTVENYGGSLFRLMVMEYYGRCEGSLWLAAWGKDGAQAERVRPGWEDLLKRLYP